LLFAGGSMQITFAPHEINTTNNLDQTFVSKVPVFNSVVTLYTHSYLGFGLMSAREATMGGPDAQHTVTVSTACMPASFSGHWENGRTKYVLEGFVFVQSCDIEQVYKSKSCVCL